VNERLVTSLGLALLAGAFGALQPKLNAELGERLGSALVASLTNFTVAMVLAGVAVALRPATRRRLLRLTTWPVPRWTLTAGLGGALVVFAGVASVPTIGVSVFSVAFFGGQIAFGLMIDRLGIGPGGRRPVTMARLAATASAVAAVVVAQIGQPPGELAPALVVLSFAAGAGVAFQSAFNGRITATLGDPLAATAVNVVVGTMALVGVVAATAIVDGIDSLLWPTQVWLYAGGALGITIVVSLAVATASLGVLRATVTMLAAQLLTAFSVDWTVEGRPPDPSVVAASLLIVGAVVIVSRRSRVVSAPAGGTS
jgi:transporter family-2 protein